MPDIHIVLSKGFSTVVDAEDADVAQAANWYVAVSKVSPPYAYGYVRGVGHRLLHVLVIEKQIGRTLSNGEYCDHIDRDSLNNRRSNLRVASARESAINRGLRKDTSSGYAGINWHKHHQQWQVRICVASGKRKTIGYFNDLNDAIAARNMAVQSYYGEFAPQGVNHATATD